MKIKVKQIENNETVKVNETFADKQERVVKRMREEFEEYKRIVKKEGMKDYNFYGVAMRYEVCEWVDELDEKEGRDIIAYLDKVNDPLEEFYNEYDRIDDDLWEVFNNVAYTLTRDR